MNNYLVKDQIPGFEQYAGKFVGLYNFLENTYGVVVTEADDTFSAVNADYLEARASFETGGSPAAKPKDWIY